MQIATRFFDIQAGNAARLPDLKAVDIPMKLIWG